MKKLGFKILLVYSFFLFSCHSKSKKGSVGRDKSITPITSFNQLFFDSLEVKQFLSIHPELSTFSKQYIDFYNSRNFEFAWFDSTGLSEQAHNFFNLQNNYINNLSDSSIYNKQLHQLYDSVNGKKLTLIQSRELLLRAELLLTGQFFTYAAKVYKGSDIDATELGWYIPRKKINLTALLDSVIDKNGKDLDQYIQQNDQYKQLEKYLIKTIEVEKKETRDTIAFVKKPIKLHDSSEIVAVIKQRLNILQDNIVLDSTELYDTSMLRSVKMFQRRHGLSVDGAIGNLMISELNVPLKGRVQQILVNMERTRWMPPQTDKNYVLVNIPEYKLRVFDSGKQVLEMNVIVGSALNNTVIFNGNLKYIVFSPYWKLPESIVRKEIMPAMRKDKNYISNHNMEITSYSGTLPNIRQKPGPTNSLGLVKFLFPNNYSIYLHDTPNRDLFGQSGRSLSHGCIRLSEPAKFAQYLLRDDTLLWNKNTIDSSMHLANEKWVTLKKSVPVFLVYFTAWVDKNGVLNFRKDIYGHDKKMVDKLFNK